jgi:site-specific DNA-methyltransferase (adenine-specific)
MNDTKLMLMDCFDGFFEIEENSIDMILVDPPYGNTSCKWDQIIPIERMWNNILRITK